MERSLHQEVRNLMALNCYSKWASLYKHRLRLSLGSFRRVLVDDGRGIFTIYLWNNKFELGFVPK